MAKFYIVVRWTQELSVEKEVEAASLEVATQMALAIDPNEDVDDEDLVYGDVVSDINHVVDGKEVGINNCPFGEEEDQPDPRLERGYRSDERQGEE